MDEYYYLVAQVPTPVLGVQPVLEPDEFLLEACKWTSRAHWRVLRRVDMGETVPMADDPGPLRSYKEAESALQDSLVRWRRARLAGEAGGVQDLEAVLRGTPLEVEMDLLELRWNRVEDLEVGHHFDIGRLVLLLLKLQLGQRLARFDQVDGLARFASLCEVEV